VSREYADEIITEPRVVVKASWGRLERRPSFVVKAFCEDLVEESADLTDLKRACATFQRELDVSTIETGCCETTRNSFTRITISRRPQAHQEFKHPNIASLYAYYLYAYLVYELAENGSQDNFWKEYLGRERLSSVQRQIKIALDVFTAIRFLHEGSVSERIVACIHWNIKSTDGNQ
jgi:hypothetical protein